MRRLPGWRVRLDAALKSYVGAPLVYGRSDCAIYAADAVCAMTGHDLAAEYRGRYRTLAGGLRVLRSHGYDGHEAFLAAHCPVVAVGLARCGDIAIFEDAADGPSLGVVIGAAARVRTRAGLGSLDRMTASRAYRI